MAHRGIRHDKNLRGLIRLEFKLNDKKQVTTYFKWSDNESRTFAVSYILLKIDGQVMVDQQKRETVLARNGFSNAPYMYRQIH